MVKNNYHLFGKKRNNDHQDSPAVATIAPDKQSGIQTWLRHTERVIFVMIKLLP